MAMVDVGHMRMTVNQRRVPMVVSVGLGRGNADLMLVLVMRIVRVHVVVLCWIMRMQVGVALAQQRDDAERHQTHGRDVRRSQSLAHDPDCCDRPEKWRRSEEHGLARCTGQA